MVNSAGMSKSGDMIRSNLTPPADTSQKLQRYVRAIKENAPKSEVEKAEKELAQALKVRPFQIKQRLPFFQKMAKALKGAQAYQHFRLASGKVVTDRRDKDAETQKGDAAKEQQKTQQKKKPDGSTRIRDGKLVQEKGRLASSRGSEKGGLERQTASDRVDNLLSKFEKMVVARFEDGKQLAKQSKDGETILKEKSDSQWKDFFQKFIHRTVKRSVQLSEIRNFLLRGLVAKGQKGIFIGDMRLNNGKVEKFVRFSIIAQILAKLKGTKAGATVTKEMLAEMTSEELMYLALSASKRKRFNLAQKASEGKFMGGRLEEMAVKELGLSLESQLREKAKKLRGRKGGGGGFGSMFEKDGEPEELPYRFVPWWHWGNLARPSKFRWVTLFFYVALFVLGIMGTVLITMKVLSGG
ncbi:MAG: hypothetical protein HN337_08070 [Deltaproteobacteria bacterium]|nr:hypothetical protein [Deltaproteobacteria bacterium]